MSHKIFLSHNHNDKPLVEAVALKLASIFGPHQVFYDSWSIQPGDGFIEEMNRGLEAPEFVFFFVSKNSLASGMVKLEWQNAIYAASRGKTRIVPVRLDSSDMPAVLRQTLFIDMCTVGLEAAIAQIVAVTQGNASFTPQHMGFSNFTQARTTDTDGTINIVVTASHFLEPHTNFGFVVRNPEAEVGFSCPTASAFKGGFNVNSVPLTDGTTANAIVMAPLGSAPMLGHAMRFQLKRKSDAHIDLIEVIHEKAENRWIPVPEKR